MKTPVWLILLAAHGTAAASAECTRIDRQHYIDGWEQADAVERIHQRIAPGSEIGCRFLPDSEQRLNVLTRYEQGILDGSGYRVYYADGSAVISGRGALPVDAGNPADSWRLTCRQIDAAYGCTLVKGELRVSADKHGRRTIGVGDDHRAGSRLLVRVQGHPAITAPAAAGFSSGQTQQLLSQLAEGAREADIGFHRATLQGATEIRMSLAGFGAAMTVMQRVLEQLDSAPPAATAAEQR